MRVEAEGPREDAGGSTPCDWLKCNHAGTLSRADTCSNNSKIPIIFDKWPVNVHKMRHIEDHWRWISLEDDH